jgi:hypothetical protein
MEYWSEEGADHNAGASSAALKEYIRELVQEVRSLYKGETEAEKIKATGGSLDANSSPSVFLPRRSDGLCDGGY